MNTHILLSETTSTCQNGNECDGEDGDGYEDDDSDSSNRRRFHETKNTTARRSEVEMIGTN